MAKLNKTKAKKYPQKETPSIVFTWKNGESLVYRRYIVLGISKKTSVLCKVDIRSTQTETVGNVCYFSGGWIEIVDADGERLGCSNFSPVEEEKVSLKEMEKDAENLLGEAAMIFNAVENPS